MKPVARQLDLTSHAGIITTGCPTVLVKGVPVARVTDMTTCPMAPPAAPPPPHVGGMIVTGSPKVFACGLPVARLYDRSVCVAPDLPFLLPVPTGVYIHD